MDENTEIETAPPAFMTRSRTRRARSQSSSIGITNEALMDDNQNQELSEAVTSPPPPPPPPLPPPQVFVQYLEEPRRKVTINEGKSVIFELTQAIEEDSLTKMSRLIEERGVDVNFTLSFKISILLKAVRCRSTKVVDYLIEKGADVESSVCDMMKRRLDTLEESHHYVHQYDRWCVRTLMKMLPILGQRACDIIDIEGRTLLHLSCFFPEATVFNYLLEFGVDPNVIDNKGSSVLSLLVSHRDWSASFKMIQAVLNLPKVNVDIRDCIVGSTPLFQSFLIKRLDIFHLLLEHGANPFIRTQAGSTLMHLPFLDCRRLLILYDLGLDVNARNNAGKLPLQDRQRFDLVFFIMILLGRTVNEDEFEQMAEFVEPNIVSSIKIKTFRGDFSPLRLQSMCRRKIRTTLFKNNSAIVSPAIYTLPIPNPLKLFLDVCSYAESVLNSLSQNQEWRRT